jgi:integrase
MASVTVVQRKDKANKKGEAPIHFRIIKNRKVSYITSSLMIPIENWDEKKVRIKGKHPHSGRLNSYLSNKFNEIQDKVLALETYSKLQTSRQIKNQIFGSKPVDFFEYATEALNKYKLAGKIGTFDNFSSTNNKLKEYIKGAKLAFNDIDCKFLSHFESYLRNTKSNSTNTINKDLRFIRNIFNQAISEDKIELAISPFPKYRLKTVKTSRVYLSEEELLLIESCECTKGTKMEVHRDMFIFASYAGGLRVSDILKLKWKDFDGTHIHCIVKKTRAQLSIKLPNKALLILAKYKLNVELKEAFIFPIFNLDLNINNPVELDAAISSATAYANKNLKIIAKKVSLGKNLSFHQSRHAFAVMALKKGVSIDKVSKIMAHSNLRETQVYAKVANLELDNAMDVFNN